MNSSPGHGPLFQAAWCSTFPFQTSMVSICKSVLLSIAPTCRSYLSRASLMFTRRSRAMKAGAIEFLIKPFRDDILLGAIQEGIKRSCAELSREAEVRALRDSYARLSHRERQVMALVVSGLLNKQVGAELGISEITVKAHRGQVMQKMKANSFADLVRMAVRLRSERTLGSQHSVQTSVQL